jgi:hypothetical protein
MFRLLTRRNGILRRISDVALGSWLRDNALARSATDRDPVNVVRHGPFEQFFLLDDQDRF